MDSEESTKGLQRASFKLSCQANLQVSSHGYYPNQSCFHSISIENTSRMLVLEGLMDPTDFEAL